MSRISDKVPTHLVLDAIQAIIPDHGDQRVSDWVQQSVEVVTTEAIINS